MASTPPEREMSPIAIIGMGMRLPGSISDADRFWKLLVNKQSGRCRVPESRYNVNGFRGQSQKETVATEYGYFLNETDLRAYDASFFDKMKGKPDAMDPQQRLLLEVIWECMENAGATNLQSSATGVYVGCFGEDWHQLVHQDTQSSDVYRVTNTSDFILSNRISYEYDLRGPSLTIRTACSSTMTALHMACQALQNGECPAAIVAGSSIIMSPSMTQDMSCQGVLSPDGRCKTFDADANGYARAEGVNAILIKPLEDAIRDNDPIRAVIRATSINSDGKTSSLGVPSTEAQVLMIRDAYKRAGINDPSRTAFIECHGTGTKAGDPMEALAVANVFGKEGIYMGSVKTNLGHTEGASGLTSVIKAVLALENEIIPPNINFSTPNPKIPFAECKLQVPVEPMPWPKDKDARVSINSFGIGGANGHAIIDSWAAYKARGTVSPGQEPNSTSIHNSLDMSNGSINGASNGIHINGDSTKHTGSDDIGGAAMENDSGCTGVIYDTAGAQDGAGQHRPVLLAISASSEKSLQSRAASIKEFVQEGQHGHSLDSIAYTLAARRVHLPYRSFCIAREVAKEQAQSGAGEIIRNLELNFAPFQKPTVKALDIVFVFTGQGAQWVGMGRDLCRWMPSFLQDVQRMDRVLQTLDSPPDWSMEDMIRSCTEADILRQVEFAQPLSAAIQMALCNLLQSFGIRPIAVTGHSGGEIAAAYAAGALTLEEAILCSYLRGQALKTTTVLDGSMVAVGMSSAEALPYLLDGVQVACENSPESITLSGDADVMKEVVESIKKDNPDIFLRQLHVDVAYHSHHMKPVGPEYERLMAPHVVSRPTRLPMYSTVTGSLAGPDMDFGPQYWRQNLESPVLFDKAVSSLLEDRAQGAEVVLVEIGPHSALQGPIRQILNGNSTSKKRQTYLQTLVRNEVSSTISVLTALGQLYVRGYALDWSSISPAKPVLTDLPSYPWDHSNQSWQESRVSKEWRYREYPHHELLGSSCTVAGGMRRVWRNMLSYLDVSWLQDHIVANDMVFPFAGYVCMMGEAIRQVTGSASYSLRDVVVQSALVLHENETVELLTTMNALRLTDYTNSAWYEFTISSFNGSSWVQHCIGQGKPELLTNGERLKPFLSHRQMLLSEQDTSIMTPLLRKIPERYLYKKLQQLGITFGPRFQCLSRVSAHTQEDTARAMIRARDLDCVQQEAAASPTAVHATTIDACLQLAAVAKTRGIMRRLRSMEVPARIGTIQVCPAATATLAAQATQMTQMSHKNAQMDIVAVTKKDAAAEFGQDIVIQLQDVRFISLETGNGGSEETTSSATSGRLLARLQWLPHINFGDIRGILRRGHPFAQDLATAEKLIAVSNLIILDIAESLQHESLPTHVSKYISWLQREKQYMRDGKYSLVPEAKNWSFADALTRAEAYESLLSQLLSITDSQIPSICRLRTAIMDPETLRAIFLGQLSALEVYTEQAGAFSDMYNINNDSMDAKNYLRLLAHANPRLRVLEIGAGTGGTTEMVLKHLASDNGIRSYTSYVFTDISPSFFVPAQERLANLSGVEYKTLDITKDPTTQGFTLGSYDLIVASNVLHTTPSLHATLRNVRSLLCPGGHLYIQELIAPTGVKLVPSIMGLLPGWWLGEADGRADQPMVSIERWDQELRATGFAGVEDVSTNDDDVDRQFLAQLISRAVTLPDACVTNLESHAPSHQSQPQVAPKMTRYAALLHNGVRSEFAMQLVTRLELDGIQVSWLNLQDSLDAGLYSHPDHEKQHATVVISALELDEPWLSVISKDDFQSLTNLVSRIQGDILWLTRAAQINCTDAAYGLILGFARTVRQEQRVGFGTVELECLNSVSLESTLSIARQFLDHISFHEAGRETSDMDYEYFIAESGQVLVGRYDWLPIRHELESSPDMHSPVCLHTGSRGRLDTMRWVQGTTLALDSDHVELNIHSVGLNFRDVLVAMGILQGVTGNPGYETAGIVTRVGAGVDHVQPGDRVVAMYHGLFATKQTVPGSAVFKIPDSLGLDEAGSMVIVFATALYAIVEKAKLQRGQSVLIHSACGGVGQAAIQIAQMLQLDIYATVGSEEKIEHLEQAYGLPRKRIFDSRCTSFYDDVMEATKGRGVDAVLNSLSGELLRASWQCVAKWGCMVEIGKRDILEKGHVALDMLDGNRTLYGVDLSDMQERPEILSSLVQNMMDYYAKGSVKPVAPIHYYPAENISSAFRYMQSGKHMGKIVIKMPQDSAELNATGAIPPMNFSSSATYLLAGGLGGLGKAVTAWMVENGARNFVFLSRSGGESNQDKTFLEELRSQGCCSVAIAGSVAEPDDVARAVAAAPTPITGVIQMSMVLRDVAFSKMTFDDWTTVQDPKVKGTYNLHNALLHANLDFFILFSSNSGATGQPGQASYASANSYLASFAHYRQSLGLPCSVIDIGAMEGVGVVGDNPILESNFRAAGAVLLSEQNLMDAVQLSIKHSKTIPTQQQPSSSSKAYTNPWHISIGLDPAKSLDDPTNHLAIRFDKRAGLAWQLFSHTSDNCSDRSEGIKLLLERVAADPEMLNHDSALEQVTLEIGDMLRTYARIPEEDFDVNMTLESLGVDSLVSIEIRSWWRQTLGVDISVLDITNAGTVARLGVLAVTSLKKKHGLLRAADSTCIDTNGGEVELTLGSSQATEDEIVLELIKHFQSCQSSILVARGSSSSKHPNDVCPLPHGATVFLTGATGFLGAQILQRLLRAESVLRVIVLVRAKSVEHGLSKVRKAAETLGWWKAEDEIKLEIWLGDLSQNQLGLTSQQWTRLGGGAGASNGDAGQTAIHAIIHNGAKVNFSSSYQELRQENVDSTAQLLQLSLSPCPSAPKFLYVSGSGKVDQAPPLEELVRHISGHFGYSQTKILSERLVLESMATLSAEQNHILMVKPGLIAGTMDKGIVNIDDIFWRVFALTTFFKRVPRENNEDGDYWVYISDVDSIATTIANQLLGTASSPQHHTAFIDIRDGIPASEMWKLLFEETKILCSPQPWGDWIKEARSKLPDSITVHVLESLASLIRFNSEALPKAKLQEYTTVDTRRVRAALSKSFRYLKEIGFLTNPSDGTKGFMQNTIRRTRA